MEIFQPAILVYQSVTYEEMEHVPEFLWRRSPTLFGDCTLFQFLHVLLFVLSRPLDVDMWYVCYFTKRLVTRQLITIPTPKTNNLGSNNFIPCCRHFPPRWFHHNFTTVAPTVPGSVSPIRCRFTPFHRETGGFPRFPLSRPSHVSRSLPPPPREKKSPGRLVLDHRFFWEEMVLWWNSIWFCHQSFLGNWYCYFFWG